MAQDPRYLKPLSSGKIVKGLGVISQKQIKGHSFSLKCVWFGHPKPAELVHRREERIKAGWYQETLLDSVLTNPQISRKVYSKSWNLPACEILMKIHEVEEFCIREKGVCWGQRLWKQKPGEVSHGPKGFRGLQSDSNIRGARIRLESLLWQREEANIFFKNIISRCFLYDSLSTTFPKRVVFSMSCTL